MVSCVGGCRSPSDWMAQFWPGSIPIFTAGHSASEVACISRPMCNSSAGSHRAQFSAQSYSSCTLLILLRWLSNMVSTFCPHLYADDTQIYGSTRPPAIHDLQQRLLACMHRRCTQLDVVQPSPAEHQQDGAALVCHCSPSAPTATICIQDWAA